MSNGKASRTLFGWALLFAALSATGLLVGGCGGGGSSESGGTSSTTPPVTPPVAPPVTFPITAIADAGGGNIIVTSANTLTAGDVILISGTTIYDGTFTVVSATATTFTVAAAFTTTATGFWQLAGGMIAGCATTGATGAINLATSVSRFTGVAPLAVFFDASGTTTTPATPRPFHDLGYGWNFGDAGPSAGIWGIGSRPSGPTASSRNSATGPLAAHVYETPGTYDVTLAITDGTNTVTNACVRIAVQDPEVVFAGANTICFSTSGTPCSNALATQVTTTDFAAAMAMAAPGKRLLFRRGETFTTAGGVGQARLSSTGPGIVGAYGAGALPRFTPAVSPPGNAIMVLSGPTTPNITDWRFMDLEFDGLSGTSSIGINGGGGAQQITFLRMKISAANTAISLNAQALDPLNLGAPGGHLVFDQIAIVDGDFQNINGSALFLLSRRLMLLGNFVNDTTTGEHDVRIQYVDKGVLQANDLGLPAITKHVLTIRAVPVGTGGVTSPNNTDQVVISDNLFRGGVSADIVSIQPSASSEDQRISNVIMDGNLVIGGTGAQNGIIIAASEVTLRNNSLNLTGGVAFNCMKFQLLGAEPAHSEHRILNNSCVSNTVSGGALRVVFLDATNTNVTIMNNIGFAPGLTGASVLLFNTPPGSTGVTGGSGTFGNSLDAQIFGTSPLFTNGSGAFTAATDFGLGVGSYARDILGVAVPVFSDSLGVLRPQGAGRDSGATEQ